MLRWTGAILASMPAARLPFLWDYDLDEAAFADLLAGRRTLGSLDRTWAAVRLLEHASYRDVRRFLSLRDLVQGWPSWRARIRSETRRRGFDFLVDWLPRERPDLL
jgi:hypothetical protein